MFWCVMAFASATTLALAGWRSTPAIAIPLVPVWEITTFSALRAGPPAARGTRSFGQKAWDGSYDTRGRSGLGFGLGLDDDDGFPQGAVMGDLRAYHVPLLATGAYRRSIRLSQNCDKAKVIGRLSRWLLSGGCLLRIYGKTPTTRVHIHSMALATRFTCQPSSSL